MRNYLSELHWESLMHDNDPEQNYQVLLDKLSYGVQKCFRPKKGKTSMNSNINFRSKNMIPREVRSLFKQKARASKILRKSTSASRILSIRRKVMNIEIELEKHYKNWKKDKENEIFYKSKENKNILYAYIKKRNPLKVKLDPF